MKLNNRNYMILSLLALFALVGCSLEDDSVNPIVIASCTDGIMNGDETDIDCGGSCTPCTDGGMMEPDFSGTYAQVDYMGRPGVNTVLSADGNIKDAHNVAIPSQMTAAFQMAFEERLEAYHDVYANLLGLDPADVNYENNILGLDAAALTGYLAADVLEVAPEVATTYFNPGADNDGDGRILVPDGDEIGLTGRTPQDDVIDISLILFFGGMEGDRFSGQDTDMDGISDLPRLTSDGVNLTASISTEFPYLGAPE
ncbi:MAG: DUF4331 family protein [Flavobacteriaceae bacterium]